MNKTNNIQMKGIYKSFFETNVLNDVSLDFHYGEVHALLGENGAGKTTLMNILTGIYAQDQGHILINEEIINYKSPGSALKAGIGMVHQRFSLVEKLNVLENLILGDPKNKFFLNYKKVEKELEKYSTLFDFKPDPYKTIESYPVGSRQKIEIIKMLMRDVSVLILDEPTSVLTAQESDKLMQTLRIIAQQGKAVIFISHKMNEVMQVADKITVLRKGQKIATLNKNETNLNELAKLMIGKDFANMQFKNKQINNERILKIENISKVFLKGKTINNINLQVFGGEVLGIAGVDGNGQKELADLIIGHEITDSGKILLNENNLTNKTIKQRIELGFAYIPENRSEVATASLSSIWENLIMKVFARKENNQFGLLKINKLKEYASTIIKKYDIVNPGLAQPAAVLSGGNLQKLILGREIDIDGEVYVFIHPTRGLDISSTCFVREKIQELSERGKIVIVISGDLDELFEISDRIAVMYEGCIMGELDRKQFDSQKIGFLMSGITSNIESEIVHD